MSEKNLPNSLINSVINELSKKIDPFEIVDAGLEISKSWLKTLKNF